MRIFGEPHEITPEFVEAFKDLWTCGGLLPPELDLGLPHPDYAYNDVHFFMEDWIGLDISELGE